MKYIKLPLSLSYAILISVLITPVVAKGSGEPVRIQIGGEPSTLDPARVIDQYGIGILRNVVEGLFKLDADGQLTKGLAASYRMSKDGLTYHFKIRPDARWSDGQPVSGADFVTGLRRALDPKTASPNSGFFFAIKNAREIFTGKKPVESLGVSFEGEEVVITLEKADPMFLYELALPTASPMRSDFLQANKGEWNYRAPVTGDFTISVYKPSERIELSPNPQKKSANQRSILYRILPEEVTAMNLFDSGRLDVMTTITPTEIGRLQKKGVVQMVPSTTVFYLSFNVQKPPFNDIEWRKAIAASIDRDGLARALNGAYVPITSYLPQPIEGALPYRSLDGKEAIAKLKAAGKKPQIRLAFGSSAFTKIVSEKIQNDLQKNLGISISLEPMELKTMLARLQSDPPEMYFLGMSAMFDDPMNQLNAFANLSEPNYSRYVSAEYEKLCELTRTTSKGEKRTHYAMEANRILVEKDVVVVPVVLRNQIFAVNKNLKGFHVSPYQVIQLNSLSK